MTLTTARMRPGATGHFHTVRYPSSPRSKVWKLPFRRFKASCSSGNLPAMHSQS